MDALPKTTFAITLPALALALVVAVGSCQRQSEPPVTPRAAGAPAGVGLQDGADGPATIADSSGGSQMEDAGVTGRVKTALMADSELKALSIHVETHDAAVTLTGTLDRDAEVARAVTIARGVAGVREVVNRLSVKGEDKAERSDQG